MLVDIASPILAQQANTQADGSTMLMWVGLLAAMALLPFLLTMITSFAKLVVVGGILRQALGTQQVPPNSVITGLALILTVHIMWPVMTKSYQNYQAAIEADEAAVGAAGEDAAAAADDDKPANYRLMLILDATLPPLEEFLTRHSHHSNVVLFEDLREDLNHEQIEFEGDSEVINRVIDLATVTAPAFILSELTEAFQIGFLLFVPFVIIDLVVSNILMAMGMHMLSPTTISLPLKLLLFVLIDGWRLVIQGLVVGYT